MVGHGRPATGQRVDVRIPTEHLELIDRDAALAGRKRAEQIRHIIANHYKDGKP